MSRSDRSCPIPTSRGRDCWRPSHPDSSLGLCLEHLQQAARDYVQPDPTKVEHPAGYRSAGPIRQSSVVYYLRWADRIKIGVSADLPSRLKAIYYDELMAVEPGTPSLEKRRHNAFAEYRLPNYREWFSAAPALLFHINSIRDKYGPPLEFHRSLIKRSA